jgi:hypothetical protein
MDYVVKDTSARSTARCIAISVWWMAAFRIPSDRCPCTKEGPTMARHNSNPLVCKRVSS